MKKKLLTVAFIALSVLPRVVFAVDAPQKQVAATPAENAASENAALSEQPPEQLIGQHPQGIYAFPGKECPTGSHVYQGPEQLDIEKTGYTYCAFNRRYALFVKTETMKGCPDGSKPVKPANEDEKIIWCDMPKAQFTSNGVYMPPGQNIVQVVQRRKGSAGTEKEQAAKKAALAEAEKFKNPLVKPTPDPVKEAVDPAKALAQAATASKAKEPPDYLKGQKVVAPPVVLGTAAVTPVIVKGASSVQAPPDKSAPTAPDASKNSDK